MFSCLDSHPYIIGILRTLKMGTSVLWYVGEHSGVRDPLMHYNAWLSFSHGREVEGNTVSCA